MAERAHAEVDGRPVAMHGAGSAQRDLPPAGLTTVARYARAPGGLRGLSVDAVVALGSSAGNAATARLMRGLDRSASATRPASVSRGGAGGRLQREVHGLATEASTTAYVDVAHRFWADPANAAKPLKALGDTLFHTVNRTMPHRCGLVYKTLGASGQFDSHTWAVWLDEAAFSKRDGVTKIGDLKQDEVANVANTVYHEFRHSEQNFLIARKLAGDGKTPAEIRQHMKIPLAVASAAARSPMGPGVAQTAGLREDADAWERSLYGKYLGYGLATQDLEKAAEKIKKLATPDSTLELYADLARASAYDAYRAFDLIIRQCYIG